MHLTPLLQATGMRPKTLGDRVSDVLETLKLKTKTPEKAAAEEVARRMQEAGTTVQGAVDSASSTWDDLLKWTGIREKSIVEQAQEQYGEVRREGRPLAAGGGGGGACRSSRLPVTRVVAACRRCIASRSRSGRRTRPSPRSWAGHLETRGELGAGWWMPGGCLLHG